MDPPLTDQARVAVEAARRFASAAGRTPGALDLVAGLGTELDGVAGHRLRSSSAAVARLAEHAVASPDGGTPMVAIIRTAVAGAKPRPAWTSDLLAVAVADTGTRESLEDLGYEVTTLAAVRDEAAPTSGSIWAASETLGLIAGGPRGLDEAAGRAIARTRALAGGAVDLLAVLALTGEPEALAPVDATALPAAAARVDQNRATSRAGEDYDAGLAVVLRVAVAAAAPAPVTCDDLLVAVLTHGGWGPRAILAAVERDDEVNLGDLGG